MAIAGVPQVLAIVGSALLPGFKALPCLSLAYTCCLKVQRGAALLCWTVLGALRDHSGQRVLGTGRAQVPAPPRDSALIPEQMRGTGHRYGPVSVVTYAYVSYAFRHVAHAGTKMCMACLLCKASLKP